MTRRRHDAWDAALHLIGKLRAAGHVALLAGGCVRDRLLSQTPKDYDVATDATPQRVREVFPKARRVGAQFGVMLVREYGHNIEVATFRTEGPYSDGRHPDQVEFGTELDDARRRDFTINGLFLDPIADQVIDHVGGRADLEAGIVRTIGDPDLRFAEDHLRMLRAVRFAARFGFEIEPATMAAIQCHAGHLRLISAERIWLELVAILTAPTRAAGWTLLLETDLREHLTETWPASHREDQLAGRRLAALPPNPLVPALVLSACLPERTPTVVAGTCRSLRLSKHLLKTVVWLVRSLPQVRDGGLLELADLKLLMAHESWPSLLELFRADLLATGADRGSYDRVCRRAACIAPNEVAPPPLVTGGDLIALGLEPGSRFGDLLDAVHRAQLNEEIATREDALKLVQELVRSGRE